VKDDSLTVNDLINAAVGSLGENIKVRRFAKFALGEG
jgi:elongation factor Ts